MGNTHCSSSHIPFFFLQQDCFIRIILSSILFIWFSIYPLMDHFSFEYQKDDVINMCEKIMEAMDQNAFSQLCGLASFSLVQCTVHIFSIIRRMIWVLAQLSKVKRCTLSFFQLDGEGFLLINFSPFFVFLDFVFLLHRVNSFSADQGVRWLSFYSLLLRLLLNYH